MIELRLPASRWVFHENRGDEKTMPVDVAVMWLPDIKDRSVVGFLYCPADCPAGQANQLATNPEPPEEVVIFGFPQLIGFQLKEPRPMGRIGAVSLTTDEPFISTELADKTRKCFAPGAFLMDSRMFPGNSGGPIIVNSLFKPLRLVGLVTATNRHLDFGIGTPVSQIIETLSLALKTEADWFSA